MKQKISLLALLFLSVFSLNAQSLSGLIKSSGESVSYGNVEIYSGDKIIGSVITDIDGKFKINLDSGVFKVKIAYISFEKSIKTIKIDSDKNEVFNLKTSITPLDAIEIRVGGVVSSKSVRKFKRARTASYSLGFTPDSHSFEEDESDEVYSIMAYGDDKNVKSGLLTAGEVNDFSKWTLWSDSSSKKLFSYHQTWDLSPTRRFTIQITDQRNLPLADAYIKLKNQKGNLVYEARSDNTGKAELWGNLTPEKANIEYKNYRLLINYHYWPIKIQN